MESLGCLLRRRSWVCVLAVGGLGLAVLGGQAFGADVAVRAQQTLDAEGKIFAPAGRGAAAVRRPITVAARFDFIEEPTVKGQALQEPDSKKLNSGSKAIVVRRYRDAVADLRIDGVPQRTVLGQDARTVHVSLVGLTPVPHLPAAPLTREEVDLLDLPFDPLLLDTLRPTERLAVGTTWTVPADAAAGLLAIDTIETGRLTGQIAEITAGRGTLTISGTLAGAVDGVPTRLVVEAVGTVPLRAAAVAEPPDGAEADEGANGWEFAGPHDQWAATIREHRQASHVAPGFELEARISVSRRPAEAGQGGVPAGALSVSTPDAASSPSRPPVGGPGIVWHHDPAGRYDLVHDARWRMVEEGDAGAVFRLVDRGTLVGQCSITALPRVEATAATTLAEVQRDIETALGSQFGQFTEAIETVRDDGTRVVRVVSAGRAGTLPFRWIHHVLTDPEGRRATAAFMVEESLAERFSGADRDLIAGLRCVGPAAAVGQGEGKPAGPADREARRPRETAMP